LEKIEGQKSNKSKHLQEALNVMLQKNHRLCQAEKNPATVTGGWVGAQGERRCINHQTFFA
jgi:hypothetical protein